MRESSSGNRPRSSSASRASRLRPSHRVSRMLVSSCPWSPRRPAAPQSRPKPVEHHTRGPTGTITRSATEAPSSRPRGHWGRVHDHDALSLLFPSSSRACGPAVLSAATTSTVVARRHSSALRPCRRRARPPLLTTRHRREVPADVLLPTPPLRFTTATINALSPPPLRGSRQHNQQT